MLLAVNDFVFKFIFGMEERKELLRSLINLTLERAGLPLAATLTLRNPFINPKHEDDKASVLDVEATDDHERIFDLEIQLRREPAYAERALFYWSRKYGDQLTEGKNYRELHPVIGIHILDFTLRPDKRHFFKIYRFKDDTDPDPASALSLTPNATLIMLELPLMPPARDCGRLEKLLLLLKNEGGDEAMVKTLTEQDKLLAEIDEAYHKFHADPDLRSIYEGRLKWQMDQATALAVAKDEGLAEGKAEGKADGKAEAARNLRQLGVSLDIIAKATGLSPEELAKI